MEGAWRLLDCSHPDPFMNLAIEEAVLRGRLEGGSPNTLRLWQNPPSAIIGRFQDPRLEVDLDLCKTLGIAVVRRVSSGGAVYQDNGNLNYAVVVDVGSTAFLRDIIESYKVFCSGVVEGLRALGVRAEFRPVNDIAIGERKISGSAQYRLYDVLLHHGTLMINVDLGVLERVLRISEVRSKGKDTSQVRDQVTTLYLELGRTIPVDSVKEALVRGFEKVLSVRFKEGSLTSWEKGMTRFLYEEKYGDPSWNLGPTSPLLQFSSARLKGCRGSDKVPLSLEGQTIKSVPYFW